MYQLIWHILSVNQLLVIDKLLIDELNRHAGIRSWRQSLHTHGLHLETHFKFQKHKITKNFFIFKFSHVSTI